MWFFYLPVYVCYLWYSLRARTMTFFTAANPGMFMGGFIDYSKYDVLIKIPSDLIPKTFLINETQPFEQIKSLLDNNEINYPFILKPDRGQRGFAVEIIKNETALTSYLSKYKTIHLVQEYINLPLEFGVLYYRMPNEEKGTISSVVQKIFLKIKGDGVSTLRHLIKTSERGQYYQELLEERFADQLEDVLANDEEMTLVEIGNHCKGATFFNRNNLINEQLIDTFDDISHQIDGFFFGRYDLRCASIEDLYAGKVKIVELNGTNSEPAHIYDPNMPLFKAYRFMFRHWKTIFKIGTGNHKLGVPYMPLREVYKATRHHYKRREKEVIM